MVVIEIWWWSVMMMSKKDSKGQINHSKGLCNVKGNRNMEKSTQMFNSNFTFPHWATVFMTNNEDRAIVKSIWSIYIDQELEKLEKSQGVDVNL